MKQRTSIFGTGFCRKAKWVLCFAGEARCDIRALHDFYEVLHALTTFIEKLKVRTSYIYETWRRNEGL